MKVLYVASQAFSSERCPDNELMHTLRAVFTVWTLREDSREMSWEVGIGARIVKE
jgi:hypothetical protein